MTISFDYAGQVVLVTGAATGLGFAIASAFGQAGASVAVNDLSPQRVSAATETLEGIGIECGGFPADVRDGTAVRAMVDSVIARFGVPDVTVVNAGIYPNTPFLEIAGDEWERVIDTNLTGAFLTCQAAARAMVAARKHGQIVTVSSGAANAAFRGWAHYSASKAALVMLTRSMALELGEHGIRANTVLPGYIDVPEGGEHLDEAYKRDARLASPLGRPGTPEDIANAVLMLASPLAGYVSGATVSVDGGAGAGRKGIVPRR
jgi:3-oxoacyl-[acyl-carrier protein] reductase